jgi:hypothetical protein
LHFEIEERGPSRSYGMRDSDGEHLFKHPWRAKSFENARRNSTILLNANGPFFRRTSILTNSDTSLGVFLKIMTPGTADLAEILPKCYAIARPRLVPLHMAVRKAATRRFPAASASKKTTGISVLPSQHFHSKK